VEGQAEPADAAPASGRQSSRQGKYSSLATEQLEEFAVKDVLPNPYRSETAEETENEVRRINDKTKRPLLKLRISKKRKEFGSITQKFSDHDNPSPFEWRVHKDPNYKEDNYRKTVEMGL
jgi:hypothetical protein